MSERIWKYGFRITDGFSITTKKGSKLLDVQMIEGEPYMWFLVDENAEEETRNFEIYGTGHPLPEDVSGLRRHQKTFTQFNGGLVWHLFEV